MEASNFYRPWVAEKPGWNIPDIPLPLNCSMGRSFLCVPYSDWLVFTVSLFRLDNRNADHERHWPLGLLAGLSGCRLLNKPTAGSLCGRASLFGFASWCLGRETLRRFFKRLEGSGAPRYPEVSAPGAMSWAFKR